MFKSFFLGWIESALMAAFSFRPQLVSDATVPASASSLNGLNATQLRRVQYERRLHQDSVRKSLWTALKTGLKVGKNGVMNVMQKGVWMDVKVNPKDGQSCRIALAKPLDRAPQYGSGEQPLGNEDQQDLLWSELYYNEIKKAIKYKAWGYFFNDTNYLNYVESHGPAMAEFMKELRDLHIYQGLLLTYDEGLTRAPVSRPQQFNPNWAIPNLATSNYPAWDITALTIERGSADTLGYYSSQVYRGPTTFVENIAAACLQGSGVGATSKALLTVGTLAQIRNHVTQNLLIAPIDIDGIATYCCLVPANVWDWSVNPNNSGSLAEYYKDYALYADKGRLKIPGEIGRVYDTLLFIKDERSPTITLGGNTGSYTIRPNYVNPGNNDDRNKSDWSATSGSANWVFDVMTIVGENALAEYLVDPEINGLVETTNYGQDQGRATYLGAGIQTPIFDKDSGSRLDGASKTAIYKGSCLVPISRTPIQAIS